MEEIKYGYTQGLVCQACLSSNRNVKPIFGEFFEILKNISGDTDSILPQPIYFCWECIAVLKKIKLFKARIAEAQKILTYHYESKQKVLLTTLSSLSKTYSDHTINITYNENDNDFKQKIEIKQEFEQTNEDYFNNYEQNSEENYDNQEIKKENDIDTKIQKKKKSLHYRIVYENNDSKKVLRKKFLIAGDLKEWWDREINSDFYKKFKHKCKLCVKGFNCKEKLKRHILKYHDESIGPHSCSICNSHFKNALDLATHMQMHQYGWECARCGFQCYTVRRLNAHIHTHRTVQCKYCDGRFDDMATFYVHYKSLHSIFLCDNCGKRCKTKRIMEKHMSRHLDTHTCPTCSRRYKSRAALRKHTSLKHSSCLSELAYCVQCDRQFDSALVYRRHVLTSAAHRSERGSQAKKNVPCPECTNTYSRRAYMMNHYRHVHMNQSKYYCTHCDRHFLNRTRYVDHMRYNHEGVKKEKNKLCNICGRGFAANRTLTNHMRTHSGERPHACHFCAAQFAQRTCMLSHIKRVHANIRHR